MTTPQPTPEQLKAAIAKHVAKSKETVAKIPPEHRTILSRQEAEERLKQQKK